MNPTSRVSSLNVDVHLVLCDFGRAGLAYVETDPAEADATTVVQNLLHGRTSGLCIIAISTDEAGRETYRRPSLPRSAVSPIKRAMIYLC
jgi:hypothetical protein